MTSRTELAGPLAGLSILFALALAAPGARADGDSAYGDSGAGEGPPTVVQSLEAAFSGGHAWLDARYRFESVDQDGFSKDAQANTLRTRLGYETAPFHGLALTLEFENVTSIGHEDFNDTVNGNTQFPTVADPETTEVNQAFLRYTGLPQTAIVFGRQRVVLDNHRFVGDVGFRQNQQTFDTVTLTNTSLPDTKLVYGYVWSVRRIFGEDSPVGTFNTNVHLVNLAYSGFGPSKVVGYAYALDIDDDATLSALDLGLRLTGANPLGGGFKLVHTLEYAHQSDIADNPNAIDLNYYLIEPGLAYGGLTAKFAYEVLEGDGASGFQTPLATLHAFQGWADKFLTTPADGIEDSYASLFYKVPGEGPLAGTKLWAIYHDFNSENTSDDLGTELDLKISRTLFEHVTLALTYASYDADTFSTDTDKLFVEAIVKF